MIENRTFRARKLLHLKLKRPYFKVKSSSGSAEGEHLHENCENSSVVS